MCIALPLVFPEELLPARGHPPALTDGTRPALCNGDTQRGLPTVFSGISGASAGIWHMCHICTIAPGTTLRGERAAVSYIPRLISLVQSARDRILYVDLRIDKGRHHSSPHVLL